MDIDLFNTNLSDKIQISVLLIETKGFGGIWSSGEHSMGIYMGGRQIFLFCHKRYIREENNKLNNRLIDKLLIQMSLLVLY
jgi:hypothetical protein